MLVTIALAVAIILLSVFCYGFYLVYPTAIFDSDQAIIGIMGKDLIEGRLIPWTFYGQKYMLAVEAWAAALSFALWGVSLTALKVPLFVVSLMTIALVILLLMRECRLSFGSATLATLPLIAPPLVLSAHLMANIGANPWVLMYIALIWLLRTRPVTLGLMLGVAYFQREFVMMGFLALLATDVIASGGGAASLGARLKPRATTLGVAFITYHVLVGLGQFNPEFVGMGTPRPHLVNAGQLLDNARYLAETLLPPLLGLSHVPAESFGIVTTVSSGIMPWSAINLVLLAALKVLVLVSLWRDRRRLVSGESPFSLPIYLILAAVGQVMLYLLFIPANEPALIRYLLLVPLALVGIFALAFIQARNHRSSLSRCLSLLNIVTILSLATANLWQQIKLTEEYTKNPPHNPRVALAQYLEAHGYRYGWANYWDAYFVSFITNETVIISASDHSRVTRYKELVKDHEGEAFMIGAPGACRDPGARVVEGREISAVSQYVGVIEERR